MGVKASLQNLNPVQSVQDRFTRLIEFYHPKAWRERGIGRTLGLFVVTYLIVVIVLGFVWSRSPATFDVRANALAAVGGDESRLVTGGLHHGHRHPHRQDPAGEAGRLSEQ